MNKNKEKYNILKKKNLRELIKRQKITSIGPEAINFLEKEIEKTIIKIIEKSKEQMIINGRKTLSKEDIQKALETQENEFEI